MEPLATYLPVDRRQAMFKGEDLLDRAGGAVLFADISGFTTLTETLVEEFGPSRGAEELTAYLNKVYEALITEVHRHGGSVIGFSGDAITCWFSGDDGRKAVACALALQQVMGGFAEIEAPSGPNVTLAIKEVVAAGWVRRFRVGDPAIQYMDVLAGALMDRVAEAEKQAGRGQIVLDAETADRLAGSVDVEWREETGMGRRIAIVLGLAVPVAKSPWPALPPVEDEESVRPWLLPPVYERLKTGEGQLLAEIRPAVSLFLRFGGLDYDRDEAAGEKLDAYVRWVQNVLARYEGYLIQLTTGDKGSYLYAVFGAPLAHDDDAARAVAAAMDLQTPPADLDFITGVQIGISRGRTWAGVYGSPARCTYGVLGDEVNVAARLMEKAEPGQVLISQRVAKAAAGRYRFQSLGLVEIRGKKEPVPVFAILGRQALPGLADLFATPLIEREAELAQLEETLEAVLAGRGQILRVEGEAGIGKSHLAAELVGRAANCNFRVTTGACQSTMRGVAYYPWQQIFKALCDLPESIEEDAGDSLTRQIAQVEAMIRKANPAWLSRLPLLGDLLGLPFPDQETVATFDPRLRREALFALVVEMVRTWAQVRPLLLLVEDAHWMDELSQELALALGRAIADVPVLLALVHRSQAERLMPDLYGLPCHRHIRLRELSPTGMARLMAHRLGGKISALALNVIQVQAQGNPFFAEELAAALRESGSLRQEADGTWVLSGTLFDALRKSGCLVKSNGHWALSSHAPLAAIDLGIPDSVHTAVLSRVDRLPEPHKQTLKVASVIGATFELELLVQSHPGQFTWGALLGQMEDMEARDLIRRERSQPQMVYAFRHHITQEVVYNTLLEEHRRGLHQAVGEALERLLPDAVERLAYHYSHSDIRDKASYYLGRAARKMQREYANEMALDYYNRALALERRWEWLEGKVEVLHILGWREEEQATLQSLRETPDAPAFDVAYLEGQYYEAIGDYAQARAAVERALEAARTQRDTVGEARCLAQLGLIARRQGDYERAIAWYTQAQGLLRSEDIHSEEAHFLIRVMNDLGIIHRQRGEYEKAGEYHEQALALSRASGNRRGEAKALDALGTVAFHRRRFAEAVSYHRQALEVERAIGDRSGEGTSLLNLGMAIREAGDYGEAEGYLLESLSIQQAIGNRWEEINVWNELGILHLLEGDLLQARTCFERGLELSRAIGDEAGRAYILCNVGQVVRDEGDWETAERYLTESLSLAQQQGDRDLQAMCLSHLALVSLRAGRFGQAIERASAALALRNEAGLHLLTTIDWTTLADAHLALGDSKSVACARQALAILKGCGGVGPEFPHSDYFRCYRVLRATGYEDEALLALGCAYELLMERADKITDHARRRAFLERPEHREIVREYQERHMQR